ncbi:MAG: sodium:alanine symporter family protein [Firmicutes bacterium]|nr:sodium:alanine symporter family protein [Bacillota bacterium]
MTWYRTLEEFAEKLSGMIWGPAMVAAMLFVGIWFTFRASGIQFLHFGTCLRCTVGSLLHGKKEKGSGGITKFQALSAALAGTMGTGNIVGVATALSMGGAGAVFWMWFSALFGMMTKYAETLLAVRFRKKDSAGQWVGGAMEYIEDGLGKRWLAGVFGVCCVFASLGMGNMTQANAIADAVQGIGAVSPWVTGVVLAAVLAMVIFGGLTRIASVTEKLIPALSVLYTLAALAVIVLHADRLPGVFAEIFKQAFSLSAAVGGAAGSGVRAAMRYGFSRGIFSNEAGLGSSGMVYAAAEDARPVEQGMWGIFEVFVDTVVVCTVTAAAILSSGVLTQGKTGAALTAAAFETVLGPVGSWFVSVSIVLFALASMLGWAYYGERGFCRLAGEKGAPLYRAVFLCAAAAGSAAKLELVWNLSEIFNGLMALPNLYAILCLSPVVVQETERWFGARPNRRKSKKY